MSLATTNFVQPYPQKALRGELGLTAHDIAKSLDVRTKEVLRKLRRNEWAKSPNWLVESYDSKNNNNGLRYTHFALNTRAAKAFVARWNNETGAAYLDWLFDCETVVVEKIPKLLEQNTKLKDEIKNLRSAKTRTIPGKGNVQFISKFITLENLFGEKETIKIIEKKPPSKVLTGIAKKLCHAFSSCPDEEKKNLSSMISELSAALNVAINRPEQEQKMLLIPSESGDTFRLALVG